MARDVVRSGVTFEKEIFTKIDAIVKNSKRYKIDKSEIINALVCKFLKDEKQIQELVMKHREEK